MATPARSLKDDVYEGYKALANFVVFGARGQPPLWPFSVIETNWYYSRFFVRELHNTISMLEASGMAIADLARLCWGPSAISHWFYFV